MFQHGLCAACLLLSILPAARANGAACEADPAVRQDLKRLDIKDVSGSERTRRERSIMEELAAKYPDNFFVQRRYLGVFDARTEAERKALIERYAALASKHPDDPDFQVLAAEALQDENTPREIEILKKTEQRYGADPWVHLQLARVYSRGKTKDRAKEQDQLKAFDAACPASDADAGYLERAGTPEMAARKAAALREHLQSETDPDRLSAWTSVWNLEFKAHALSEHPQVREGIKADLRKLETLPRGDDGATLLVLRDGYKLADDPASSRRAEDRLLAEFSKSTSARDILENRFYKEHTYPGPSDSEEKQQAYYRAQLAVAEDALKRWPDDLQLLEMRFYAAGQLKDVKDEDVNRFADPVIAAAKKESADSMSASMLYDAAQVFIDRKMRVSEVPALVAQAQEGIRSENELTSDNWDTGMQGFREDTTFYYQTQAIGLLLDAAKLLGKPEIGRAVAAELATVKADKPARQQSVWNLQAKLADLEGRKLDALLLYRAVLDARPADFKTQVGKPDDVAEAVARLRKELGGTEATAALWAKKAGAPEVEQEGRWEKPTKPMPAWELADLAGKTWKMKTLEGKTLLINIWASWCGPCQQEHPHLQKLYESTKNRPDIQIVTFNVDTELGNVEPYIKEKGYTFPVLLASDYIDTLLPTLSIPRNWIVDTRGKWRWEQIGFGAEDNWEGEMVKKLESARPDAAQTEAATQGAKR